MKRRAYGCAALVFALACMAGPASALPRGGRVVLGFGERYSAGSATRTHRGADVAADVGDPAEAVIEGVVTFAGQVPGDGGGTVGAVTVEGAEGRVTLMPLGPLDAHVGERVSVGERLGRVAASGDGSTDAPHVHVSLRRGDLYMDPTQLLVAPASTANVPQPESVAAPMSSGVSLASAGAAAVAPAAAPAVAEPSVVPAAGVPAVTPVADAGVVPTPAQSPAGAQELGEGVRLAAGTPSPAAVPPDTHAGVLSRKNAWLMRTTGAAAQAPGAVRRPVAVSSPKRSISPSGHQPAIGTRAAVARHTTSERASAVLGATHAAPAWLVPTAASAACALAVALIAALSLARFTRGITMFEPVSDRLGRLLQQLRAGDTICGLNSCSGHSAFTVPGPLAQRR